VATAKRTTLVVTDRQRRLLGHAVSYLKSNLDDVNDTFLLDGPGLICATEVEDLVELIGPAGLTDAQRTALRHQLMDVDARAAELRRRLGVSNVGEVVWSTDVDLRKKVDVRADGLGGAEVLYYRDCGDDSMVVLEQKKFDAEAAAVAYARATYADVADPVDETLDEAAGPGPIVKDLYD
jgi:hypothetical protein